jgi:hypothetical protein
VRREHRKPTRAELARITSSRPVVRRLRLLDRGRASTAQPASPDARNPVNFLAQK